MSASPLTIVAIATAAPGQQDVLRARRKNSWRRPSKNPGCLRYELHQSREDSRILVFVETWASEAQWRAHMPGRGYRAFPCQRREQAHRGFLAASDDPCGEWTLNSK